MCEHKTIENRKVLEPRVLAPKVPEVIQLQRRVTTHRRARPAVAAAAVRTMTTTAAITTAAREMRTTTTDVEGATTPMSATMKVAVAAAMIPRRAARTRIHDREMMAVTLGFAARWKAMGARIGAIGLSRLKMAK